MFFVMDGVQAWSEQLCGVQVCRIASYLSYSDVQWVCLAYVSFGKFGQVTQRQDRLGLAALICLVRPGQACPGLALPGQASVGHSRLGQAKSVQALVGQARFGVSRRALAGSCRIHQALPGQALPGQAGLA